MRSSSILLHSEQTLERKILGKGDRTPLFLNRTRAPARFPLCLRLTVWPGPWISRSSKSTEEARKLGHKSDDGVESLMLSSLSLVKIIRDITIATQ